MRYQKSIWIVVPTLSQQPLESIRFPFVTKKLLLHKVRINAKQKKRKTRRGRLGAKLSKRNREMENEKERWQAGGQRQLYKICEGFCNPTRQYFWLFKFKFKDREATEERGRGGRGGEEPHRRERVRGSRRGRTRERRDKTREKEICTCMYVFIQESIRIIAPTLSQPPVREHTLSISSQ